MTAVCDPNKNADYKWAGMTDYSGAEVFPILNFLQPNSEPLLSSAAKSILKLLPDAPDSNEVYEFGNMVIELARQIPYHHPSHVKLARLMERVTSYTMLMKQKGVSPGNRPAGRIANANAIQSTFMFELSDSRTRCVRRIPVSDISSSLVHLLHHNAHHHHPHNRATRARPKRLVKSHGLLRAPCIYADIRLQPIVHHPDHA